MFQVSSSPFPFPFCLFLACPFSFALFCFLLGVSKGQAAAARSHVSLRPGRVLFTGDRALAEPPDPGVSGASGFRGECVKRKLSFIIRLPADGGRGEVRCLAPAALLPLSELNRADVFLCGALPEEDASLAWTGSPGRQSGLSFCRAEGWRLLLFAVQVLPALRGADRASSCAYASASPGLHAGDSGDMRGSGVLWDTELLFTHHSSFSISQLPLATRKSPLTNHHGGEEGVQGIPFSPHSCALTQGYRPDLPGAQRGAAGRI